jgi:putative tryptophan/tyrosine transport system substrate-binding protein
MRRRDFVAGLGIVAFPLAAWGQQDNRVRRIGALIEFDQNDPEAKAYLDNFIQALATLGWNNGRNMRLDARWAAGSVDEMRTLARELVGLQPDVILASSTPVTTALQRETRLIPIVFVLVSDPIAAGFVATLSRPGGNITGFSNFEFSFASKWLDLLTELAPGVTHAAAMFNPDTTPGRGLFFLGQFETAARSLKIEASAAPVRTDAEIEAAIATLARAPGAGLVVFADGFMNVHRVSVIGRAIQKNIPTVAGLPPSFVRSGGLLTYTADPVDIYRRSAAYVDRILRGEKPADLPVQYPVKFTMALNLRTAKTMGIAVPPSILVRADEVIE